MVECSALGVSLNSKVNGLTYIMSGRKLEVCHPAVVELIYGMLVQVKCVRNGRYRALGWTFGLQACKWCMLGCQHNYISSIDECMLWARAGCKCQQWVRARAGSSWNCLDLTKIFSNVPKYWRICEQKAINTHLKHPKSTPDSLLDTSIAGAMDSM